MKPLEMNNSAASCAIKDSTNIIAPHVPMNGKLSIRRYKTNSLMQQQEFIQV
jgi:hypothetical protein